MTRIADINPITDHKAGRQSAHSPRPGWIGFFLTAAGLYSATANRGAQWQDSGDHILRIVVGELLNPRGLALTHPLHYWLGRLVVSADFLEPCFAITLISALAAAAAAANTYGCALLLTGRRSAASLAAASLTLAHTFWRLATVTETSTLTAALFSGELWCLVAYARHRRPEFLLLTALCNGLGIANHMQASLTTPIVVVVAWLAFRRREVRAGHLASAAGAWLIGSLPYTGMVIAQMVRTGDVTGTIHSALVGHHYAAAVFALAPSPRSLLHSGAFVILNFPNLLLPLALYGIVRAKRCGVPVLARRAIAAALVIHAVFAFRYNVVDQHTFFLPTYVLLTLYGGIGITAMARWPARRRRIAFSLAVALLAATPVVYALTPAVARRFAILDSVARNKPYRDDYRYLFLPWSVAEGSADRMSRHAVELAGFHGLIVVEDPMAVFAIRYRAVRDGAEGLDITHNATPMMIRTAANGGRPVVLVPLDADAPKTKPPIGTWRRVGDLYTLELRGVSKGM